MKPLDQCRLYTFVDLGYLRARAPEDALRALCDGGSDLVQLRAKNASPDTVRKLAERLLPIAEQAGVGLVLNDHWRVALELGAPLCHLGQEDFFDAGYTRVAALWESLPSGMRGDPVQGESPSSSSRPSPGCSTRAAVRRTDDGSPRGEPRAISARRAPIGLGLSSHAPAQAERAVAAGAAYLGVGPVFATPTKPGAGAVTLDYVRWAAAHLTVPWFAIGGIHLGNLDAVLAAGARRVCVVSAILNAPDIAEACREFKRRLAGGR